MTKTQVLRSIRQKCLDCCCGDRKEVSGCNALDCPLHPLRFGKDPDKRQLSPEERERRANLLAEARKRTEKRKEG